LAKVRRNGTTPVAGWPEYIRNSRNIGDMRAWKDHYAYKRSFDRLLRDLRAEGAAPSRDPA
jgi:hypothetical protein